MSWTKIEPRAHNLSRPPATMAIGLYRKAGARLKIGLSAKIIADCGGLATLDVSAGDGEDADSYLLEFKKDGAFKVALNGRGGGCVSLAAPEGFGDVARVGTPCAVTSFTRSSVILRIPVAIWKATSPAAAPAKSPGSPPPPPATSTGKVGALDMAVYLENKGRTVQRASAGFLIDGIAKTFDQALRMVNAHRQEAGLPSLEAEKAW